MTNEEFDSAKLPVRITFKESETARLILVHGFTIELASQLYGVSIVKINETLKYFNES